MKWLIGLCIVNGQAAGEKLIDEFDEAGGVPAVMNMLGDLIDTSLINYTGNRLATMLSDVVVNDETITRRVSQPVTDAQPLPSFPTTLPTGCSDKSCGSRCTFIAAYGQSSYV